MPASPVLAAKQPNIVVIWGDDVGYWNVSAYNQGMMGYETPTIDSVVKEGALFTDWYAQKTHREMSLGIEEDADC
jgi:arylsulfatase